MVPYYHADTDLAFDSVQHIIRNVNYGWLVKYAHEIGSTFIFLLLYFHIWRGLMSRSYKLKGGASTWISGMVLYMLLMIISFLGYVLPWSQMGYWAATVISNFLTVLGDYGVELKTWFWGGGNLSNTSLARFFCLHYGLSILLVILIFIHIAVVHKNGSSNPINASSVDLARFNPSFFQKDFLGFTIMIGIFGVFVLGWPHAFAHPENFVPADPLVTPPQITPEWYFLPFYAILRSIDDKDFGIIIMFGTIITFFLIPLFDRSKSAQGDTFDKAHMILISLFISNFIFLGIIGAAPIVQPFIDFGQKSTIAHYVLYVLIFCILPWLEKRLYMRRVATKIGIRRTYPTRARTLKILKKRIARRCRLNFTAERRLEDIRRLHWQKQDAFASWIKKRGYKRKVTRYAKALKKSRRAVLKANKRLRSGYLHDIRLLVHFVRRKGKWVKGRWVPRVWRFSPIFFLIDTFEYTNFFVFLITTFLVGCLLTIFSLYFTKIVLSKTGSKKIDKFSPYECGFLPYGDARGKFDVHFYMVGLFFIIFDLEIILILPWALNTQVSGYFGFKVVLVFLTILGLGIIYEWNAGALNWFFKPDDLKK